MTSSLASSDQNRVDLAETAAFDIGSMRVVPAALAVELNGERISLQPRVMQVLVALAQERSEVVSRDRLVERCWDGLIVSDDAINRCVVALRKLALKFDPVPFSIETIPRVGHRLVEASPHSLNSRGFPCRGRLVITIALFAIIFVGGTYFMFAREALDEQTTIAVLPFQDISGGDGYLAAGMGEEVLAQLANDPQFQVAGKTSSDRFGGAIDPQNVGRELGVEYIVEGSVRQDTGRLRVDAALVKTSNGMRIWSETYDHEDGDLLAVQNAIGNAIAGALRRTLVQSPQRQELFSRDPQAYRSYLIARGMLRTRNPQVALQAASFLDESVRRDPEFGLAWSNLAMARRLAASLEGQEKVVGTLPSIWDQARKGVRLGPNLAETHGILGALLGYTPAQAQAELRRAGELAPNDAEAQLWRATAQRISGRFDLEIASYERAHALDPDWYRPTRDLAVATAEMGDRLGAESITRQGFPGDQISQDMLLARIAWLHGDFSEAADRWAKVAVQDTIWAGPAKVALYHCRRTLRLPIVGEIRPPVSPPELRNQLGRAWIDSPPSLEKWRSQNRSEAAALTYREENVVLAKLLLNEGEGDALLAQYDGPIGLLGFKRNQELDAHTLHIVPLIALALRQGHREPEAQELLSEARAKADTIMRWGPVPFTFEVDLAAIVAMQGDVAGAISYLTRARTRGWVPAGVDDLPDFATEPAFSTLANDDRFVAFVRSLEDHFARERRETIALDLPDTI